MPDGSIGVSVPMPSDNAGRVPISDDLKARQAQAEAAVKEGTEAIPACTL